MNNIFIGMLFVFLDFNIDFGTTRVGLIPDFIGYILIAQGLAELTAGNDRFSRVRPVAIGMAVYTALLYALDLFGMLLTTEPLLMFLLGLASTILSLYVSYSVVMGINDLEAALEQDLNARSLYTAWTVLAVLSLAVYMLSLLPVLSLVCLIAGFIVGIVFLVMLNRTKNLYYNG